MREPCCSVGYTATNGDGGHIKRSNMYIFTWLPKGYGPSIDQRTVCALFDAEGRLEGGLANGERHPLVEAIASAIEKHFRENPAEVTGFLDNA